jgi:hypothetical protein
MIGAENGNRPPLKRPSWIKETNGTTPASTGGEGLQLRVQQLSLSEQLERNHFLLERLYASSARLVQALETGDVFEAIAEIIANLIGSEEVAIFDYCPAKKTFSLEWALGVEPEALQHFASGPGMFGRAAELGISQFKERQPDAALLHFEKDLTACVILKPGSEVVGLIAIFGLLPQKSCLGWVDFELFKFLETYAAVAIQFQKLQRKQVAP